MASNRVIHCVIVTCLVSVIALLGGCSPPLPKTLLTPSDGTILIDRWHGMADSTLTAKP